MSSPIARFNTYLLLMLLAAVACGCKSPEQRTQDKTFSRFWLHLDAPLSDPDTNHVMIVSIAGIDVGVRKTPFLTEANVQAGSVVDTPGGGWALKVVYDDHGRLMLDTYTSQYRGRHLVIFSEFGLPKKKTLRWLAAPLIGPRIANGTIIFTPQATREEAEQIALGLNNAAKQNRKPWVF